MHIGENPDQEMIMKKVVLQASVVLAVAVAALLGGGESAFASPCQTNCGNQCTAAIKGWFAGCDELVDKSTHYGVCVDCDCKGGGQKMNVVVETYKCDDASQCKISTPVENSGTNPPTPCPGK